MSTLAARPVVLALLLSAGAAGSGCAEPVSNDIFASDRVFLEALPSKERHAVDVEEDGKTLPPADTLPADAPFMLALTVGIAEDSNESVFEVLEYVDAIRTLPPTSRETNHRTWGPHQHAENLWLKVDMSREGRSIYDWSFSVALSEDGTFVPFLYGSHFAGDSVARGDGAFVWDWGALAEELGVFTAGEWTVDYDNRVGKELLVEFNGVRGDAGGEAVDGAYWYWSDGVAGDFEARFPLEITDDDDESTAPLREQLQLRTRWLAGEGGRSDGSSWDGDWGDTVLDVTECWSAENRTVYLAYESGWVLDEGDPSLCVFGDVAEVEHLPGEGPPD